MDKSGAVNMMFHSEGKVGDACGAEWYIWPHESIAGIARVVRPEDSDSCAVADPILSEMYFLDEEARRDVFLQSGNPPWRVLQQPGDAVFIPPRCPHQVQCHGTPGYKFSHSFRSRISVTA
jgi:hypothetical protein